MEFGLLLALLGTFLAGGIQRVTGMGFALCATPLLVAVYGAAEGVRLVVFLGIVVSVGLLASLWRQVQWRTALKLIWPGLAISPVGAAAVFLLPEGPLLLLVGGAAMASLIAGHSAWLSAAMAGRGASIKAGAASGFLNLTSGLSGPPLIGYAEATRMPRIAFVASVQVVFVAFDAVTIAWRGFPTLPLADTAWLLVAVAGGLGVTSLAARFIPPRLARLLMFTVAWSGTVVVVLKGLFALGL